MSSRGKKKNPDKVREPLVQVNATPKKQALAETRYKKFEILHDIAVWGFIAFTVVFLSLSLMSVDIDIARLTGISDTLVKTATDGRSQTLNMNLYNFLGAAFTGNSSMQYIFNNVPALSYVEESGFAKASDIANSTSQMRDLSSQLGAVYTVVFVLSLIIVILLVALSVVAILRAVKYKNISRSLLSAGICATGTVVFVMFCVFFAVIVEAGKGITFSVGIGMWLALILWLAGIGLSITEYVQRRKLGYGRKTRTD